MGYPTKISSLNSSYLCISLLESAQTSFREESPFFDCPPLTSRNQSVDSCVSCRKAHENSLSMSTICLKVLSYKNQI